MFTKHDESFAEMAVDAVRRKAAIADLTSRRNTFFWSVCLATVAAITASLSNQTGGVVVVMFAALEWVLLFKFEADLRLLKVIERLHVAGQQQ